MSGHRVRSVHHGLSCRKRPVDKTSGGADREKRRAIVRDDSYGLSDRLDCDEGKLRPLLHRVLGVNKRLTFALQVLVGGVLIFIIGNPVDLVLIGTVQGRRRTICNGIHHSLDWSGGELTFKVVDHVICERENWKNSLPCATAGKSRGRVSYEILRWKEDVHTQMSNLSPKGRGAFVVARRISLDKSCKTARVSATAIVLPEKTGKRQQRLRLIYRCQMQHVSRS